MNARNEILKEYFLSPITNSLFFSPVLENNQNSSHSFSFSLVISLKLLQSSIGPHQGPAFRSVPMVEKLLRAGMNVARFNFSHGSRAYHEETLDNLRAAMLNTGILSAIMLDTKVIPHYLFIF